MFPPGCVSKVGVANMYDKRKYALMIWVIERSLRHEENVTVMHYNSG